MLPSGEDVVTLPGGARFAWLACGAWLCRLGHMQQNCMLPLDDVP
jgi:hypothetical protein